MAVTLTDSHRAELAHAQITFIHLVSFDTPDGVYHFSYELTSWSGLLFLPRLASVGALAATLEGTREGVIGAEHVGIHLANADGWCTRRGPEFFRGRDVTVREVLPAVESDALRTWLFRATHLRMVSPERAEIVCEDRWAHLRRQLVPRSPLLIDRTLFPSLREGATAIGHAIPALYGRVRVPLQLVDDTIDDTRWIACQGSATLSGQVTELFNEQHSAVASAALEYGLVRGTIPVTFVRIVSPIYVNGTPLPHFADLTGPIGNRPDQVLIDLLTGPGMGAVSGSTLINSDTLVTAHSFYVAHSLGFDAVVAEQRPLEDYLGAWARESLTSILVRDQFYLQPQASQAPVGSVTASHVLAGRFTVEDAPVRDTPTLQQVRYTDRTTGVSQVASYAVGSGTTAEWSASFVGTPGVAYRIARYYAREAAMGVRRWEWSAGPRASAYEPGDLLTLTYSLYGVYEATARVRKVQRLGPRLTLRAAATSQDLYEITPTAGVPLDPTFTLGYQFARFVAGDSMYALAIGQDSLIAITCSHQLNQTPVYAAPRFQRAGEPVASSLTAANDSETTVQLVGQATMSSIPLDLNTQLLGFELRV